KRLRIHGFRSVARQVLQEATESDREILNAYVAGVNAGLRNLRSRPWEYWVLGVQPAPWRAEDT
ncbi:penicillin acylase family protein, partial [Salmonella enterica]|uniref:penicillin acylase family protein n=1 Tax=Salmonella enterica TaxID=28901 RepID=UPI00329A74D7